MSVPSSTIKICSGVMINNSYAHTIWFDTPEQQEEYFEGKVVKTFSSYTYLRKHWDIKVNATMEEALSWTYLFFKNGVNHKTYYYFINDIEYINENTVLLSIEMDVMQTYAFDYTLARSFVDREHSATDEFGEYILDEALDLGEPIVYSEQNVDLSELCVLVLSSFNPAQTTEETTVSKLYQSVNGVFSGLGIYAVDSVDYASWGGKLNSFDAWGKSDGIINMWVYPKELVHLKSGYEWGDDNICKEVVGAKNFLIENTSWADSKIYQPHNMKSKCYPFHFLYVTNNNGGSAVYKYEHFGDLICSFNVSGSLSADGVCKISPQNYKGLPDNYDEGLTLGNFPTCAWDQDIYKLWLAQNQNQQNLGYLQGAVSVGAGLITALGTGGLGAGAGLGMAYHGLSQVMGQMAQRKDMEVQPPQAKGNHSSNVNLVNGKHTFTIQHKGVDLEHAVAIDHFFDLYGYKTNKVKIPNRKVRQNWTYTKTVGCNVYGNLCNEDLMKIRSIFDEGITFWVNGDFIGNYGLDNKCW